MENNSNILKKAKNIVLLSNENWIVRNEESDIVNLLYKKEGEKASCGTSCCLGCFFLPVGIIYAILGGKNAVKKQVNVHEMNGEITITGDSTFLIKIYELLKKSEIGYNVKENDALIKARKSKMISNILIVILIITIILIIVNS
ncbi:MAG: hypothetical protein QM490_05610 [Candidatus Gracilibacteria bacterium]